MNLVYGLALHEFSVAQVDRAPAQCLGGHRIEFCRGLRFFLCPMLVTCRLFHFHLSTFPYIFINLLVRIRSDHTLRIF